MDKGYSEGLQIIVDEFLMLVSESADYQVQPELHAVLNEACQRVGRIRNRLTLASGRYVVGVVGLSNVGKSTLLNALLGGDLTPRRNGPCTPVPIEFTYGDNLRVTVQKSGSLSRPSWLCQNLTEIHGRLAAVIADTGETPNCDTRKVIVQLPLPLLKNGLILADTPGFGAVQSEKFKGSHEQALKRYLEQEVSQVFWVVLADQQIGNREKSFHGEFFAEVCDDIVVTGSEDWEAHDRERFRKRFSSKFASQIPQFHFVSGLMGLRARKENNPLGLETAGITMLESRLRELANPLGRVAQIEESLHQLARDLGFWFIESGVSQKGSRKTLWRPDSWSRWRYCAPNHPIMSQLVKELSGEA